MKQCILGLCAVALLASCGGPQESASMTEAKAVHEQLTRISGELHDAILDAMEPLEGQIDSAMVAGDTLLAAQLAKLEGKLDRIDVRFHDWSETVMEIPGQACTHDHSHEGHDHGDHAGHDHGHDHSHDHGATLPDGLSDEEILEIQQALLAALDSLRADFDRATE
jgi:hypothetical protein